MVYSELVAILEFTWQWDDAEDDEHNPRDAHLFVMNAPNLESNFRLIVRSVASPNTPSMKFFNAHCLLNVTRYDLFIFVPIPG
jgi:hypothetical protein